MHLLLNQSLAEQHRKDIQGEVEMARLAALCPQKTAEKPHHHLPSLLRLLNRTKLSSRQPVVRSQPTLEEIPLTEIKPALQATFSVMRKGGLVSDFDDTFIEQFSETFERELVHQVQCH
jgi:hypothetical protein